MNLVILPKSNELLDIAFRKARKESAMLKSQRNRIKDAKGKSIRRIEVSGNYVAETLRKAVEGFPSMRETSPFYSELITATIDVGKTLKALGHMTAERRIILRLKGQAIGRIKGLEKTEAKKAAGIVREYYGRLSNLVKKLVKSIETYNQAARTLKELPKIKPGLPTAIIAGCPNTGKSTILGKADQKQAKGCFVSFYNTKAPNR
ncbi:unnamed protein product, partial [marine sediment metagenome]